MDCRSQARTRPGPVSMSSVVLGAAKSGIPDMSPSSLGISRFHLHRNPVGLGSGRGRLGGRRLGKGQPNESGLWSALSPLSLEDDSQSNGGSCIEIRAREWKDAAICFRISTKPSDPIRQQRFRINPWFPPPQPVDQHMSDLSGLTELSPARHGLRIHPKVVTP